MLGWLSAPAARASWSKRRSASASAAARAAATLDGHLAAEARVAGAIDLAHASRAEQGDDLVGPQPRARGQLARRGRRSQRRTLGGRQRRRAVERPARRVRREQGGELRTQRRVLAAALGDEVVALLDRPGEGGVEEGVEAAPARGSHEVAGSAGKRSRGPSGRVGIRGATTAIARPHAPWRGRGVRIRGMKRHASPWSTLRAAALLLLLPASAAPAAPAEAGAARPALDLATARVVDLTHAYGPESLFWPSSPPETFQLRVLHHGQTPGGFFYASNAFCTPEHGGTHMDAPLHFARGQWDAAAVPVERLVAPAVVLDVRAKAAADRDYRLTRGTCWPGRRVHGRVPAGPWCSCAPAGARAGPTASATSAAPRGTTPRRCTSPPTGPRRPRCSSSAARRRSASTRRASTTGRPATSRCTASPRRRTCPASRT